MSVVFLCITAEQFPLANGFCFNISGKGIGKGLLKKLAQVW